MPTPVSRTRNTASPVSDREVETITWPPGMVNLIEFDRRLSAICRMLRPSATTLGRPAARAVRMMMRSRLAWGCMIATDWKALDASAPADLTPAGYAISGLFDLEPLLHLAGNAEFKLDAAEARRISPLYWNVERGRVLDAVVGGDESSEFLRHSKLVADAWRGKGVETRYEAIPGLNHFTVCDPLADPNSAMTRRMVELAKRT